MLAPARDRVFDSVTMPKAKNIVAAPHDRLSIRVDLASGVRIGPGKIAVLEEIARSGSISAAGRALRMSYRRTWELVEDLNRGLGSPVVATAAGGSGGCQPGVSCQLGSSSAWSSRITGPSLRSSRPSAASRTRRWNAASSGVPKGRPSWKGTNSAISQMLLF